MNTFSQGDIIRIRGFKNAFLVISKNAFIQHLQVFHVCPLLENLTPGPLHIPVSGIQGTKGVAVCEQLKLIDPEARSCSMLDRLPYPQVMEISDAVQGIFEYD